MKKIMTIALFCALTYSASADIGLVNEITYSNTTGSAGNTGAFQLNELGDITLTVQNANTSVAANAVWVYLKFPCQQFWQPNNVVTIPTGWVLEDSLNSGNETILKFRNSIVLPAPTGLPNLYSFVVRGRAIASSASYSANGVFQGNYANMEYANGIVQPGVTITPNSISPGLTKNASVTGVPLPVNFSPLQGAAVGATTVLDWSTYSESNNIGFDIERSKDGKKYQKIDFVATKAIAGKSDELLAYSFVDNKPAEGRNFYRLKQVSGDDKAVYSNVVFVDFAAANLVRIFPNPAKSSLTVSCKASDKLTILSSTGQQIALPIARQDSQAVVDVSSLSNGQYFIQMQSASDKTLGKFVVSR